MSTPLVITVQGRGRVNLGKLARHQRYLGSVLPDGTIVLEPAVVISLAERLRAAEGRAEIFGEDDEVAPM